MGMLASMLWAGTGTYAGPCTVSLRVSTDSRGILRLKPGNNLPKTPSLLQLVNHASGVR